MKAIRRNLPITTTVRGSINLKKMLTAFHALQIPRKAYPCEIIAATTFCSGSPVVHFWRLFSPLVCRPLTFHLLALRFPFAFLVSESFLADLTFLFTSTRQSYFPRITMGYLKSLWGFQVFASLVGSITALTSPLVGCDRLAKLQE